MSPPTLLMCSFDLFWRRIHWKLLDGNYLSSAETNVREAWPIIIKVLHKQINERRSVCVPAGENELALLIFFFFAW